MPETPDWTLTTFDGLRLKQLRDLAALSFREKLRILEELDEVAQRLAPKPKGPRPADAPPSDRTQ